MSSRMVTTREVMDKVEMVSSGVRMISVMVVVMECGCGQRTHDRQIRDTGRSVNNREESNKDFRALRVWSETKRP
ncbi:hypothetical protein Tco_0790978 [Tanacetum coccineum]